MVMTNIALPKAGENYKNAGLKMVGRGGVNKIPAY